MVQKVVNDASFGVVLYQETNPQTFLIVQHVAGHWGFPKGHAEGSESAQESALRELKEETGITNLELLPDTTFLEKYSFTENERVIHKIVTYFIGKATSDQVTLQAEEIQAHRWATYEEALTLLSFQSNRGVLMKVNRLFRKQEISY